MMKIQEIRSYFPQAAGENIYLDSASTTLKLKPAIDRVLQFYLKETANVHRGIHKLSSNATAQYEKAREVVADFLSAKQACEIVFTRSTTEGINFLSQALKPFLQQGDEILITDMEHHSNYLPWRVLADKYNFKIQSLPVTASGDLDESQIDSFFTPKVKILSFVHQSNSLGTVNSYSKLIQKARALGIITIVDAAQSVNTMKINVQEMDCDFLVFSGHKVFSPSGVGVVYGKKSWWDQLEPFQTGGGMVLDSVKKIWADVPHRFEAGTPPIEGVLALAESLSFLKNHVDFSQVQRYEKNLLEMAEFSLKKIPGLRVIGTSPSRINILSFVVEGFHSDDIGQVIGAQKIAVRSGHHCCQPLMEKYKLPSGTVRVSFSVYNREEEVEALEKSVKKALSVLS